MATLVLGGDVGRKAKHHYIPKCYLKGFANGGEDSSPFWCVPINNDAPFKTSPNNSCSKRDYYAVDHNNSLVVEDFYAEEIEPKISRAINYINEYSSLPPKEEMRHLLLLLATLYLRVPSFRQALEAPRRRAKEIVASISKDIPISNRDDFDYNQTDLVKSELNLIDYVQECLTNKYFQLHVVSDPEVNLVTTDRPFLLAHPKIGKGFYFGLNSRNIEITVPITKKTVVIARNEPCEEGAYIANKKLIGLVNTKLIRAANRFFYTCHEDVLLADEDINTYKHTISTNKAFHRTSR